MRFLVCLAGACLLASAALAQDSLQRTPKRLQDYGLTGLDVKIPLTTTDPWDVAQLIDFLALKGGLNNLVIGKGVAGLTTKLRFDDVTVGDALEVVLSVNNLAFDVRNGIVTIMTDAEYRTQYGTSFYDQKQVRVVVLKYADATRVSQILASVKSEIGTVVADSVTGTLVLIDTPPKIAEMEAIISKADLSTVSRVMPTETRTFALQYANIDDVQTELAAVVTKDVGSVIADKRTKTLIVSDLPYNIERIERVVKVFDRRPKEVFIEAKIVQVRLSDNFRLGVQWNHLLEMVEPRFSLNSVSQPDAVSGLLSSGIPTFSADYSTIVGRGDLNVVLEALKTVGDTKILSNPHVAVLDGAEAVIKVITDQPYAEAQLESGTTNVIGEIVKFIEVGTCLSVTPRITDEAMVVMSIKPEVSTVVGQYSTRYGVPVVRKSYAETSVMVKDGETVIIAGMIENTKQESESRVPILGRIPILGVLFRSRQEASLNEEIVAFLTPRVMTGEEPVLLLRDASKPLKPLREVGGEARKELKTTR